MAALIDTDVMIDVSRGNAGAASYLDSLSDLPLVCAAILWVFLLRPQGRGVPRPYMGGV
jgi:hypothetical protein